MNKFWRLLQRINVQMVAIVAVLALVALIIWRLWIGHATPWKTVKPPSRDDSAGGTNAVGESFFSWSRELRTPLGIERNPFSSPALNAFLAEEERLRLEAERAAAERAAAERAAAEEAAAAKAAAELAAQKTAEAKAAEEKAAAEQAAAPKPPPPTTRNVVLVYRGMLVRPDQTVLALVENKTDTNTTFYKVGENVTGLAIAEIARNTLGLTAVDNTNAIPSTNSIPSTNATLTVNKPQTFKEDISHAR
jgi:nucleoid-associated protein YgaU